MLLPLNYQLPAEKLRYHLILSRDIDDQRILQSNWMRAAICHIHPKVEVSDQILSFSDGYLNAKHEGIS